MAALCGDSVTRSICHCRRYNWPECGRGAGRQGAGGQTGARSRGRSRKEADPEAGRLLKESHWRRSMGDYSRRTR